MVDDTGAKRQEEFREREIAKGVRDIRVRDIQKMKERFNKIKGNNNTKRLEWLLKKAKK